MKYLFVFLLCLPLVMGQQLGVAPNELYLADGEAGEIIIFNQNPFPVNYSLLGRSYMGNPSQGSIDSFSEKRVTLVQEKYSDDIFTIGFSGAPSSGLDIFPELYVQVFAKDSKSYQVSSTLRIIPKIKRNLGPVLSFVVFVVGLLGYLTFRNRHDRQRSKSQNKLQKS
jgi:hypothetical protein